MLFMLATLYLFSSGKKLLLCVFAVYCNFIERVMEVQQSKMPRKRVANFTADEKALLANLIKNMPIVESKLTDGKSVTKKQQAWDLITRDFNSNANVHKRETIALKRAWDNMKAYTRKARATERGNLLRTGGGPPELPPTPQHGAIISMVEEAAPAIICEIKNTFDSDGTILKEVNNSQELDLQTGSASIDTKDYNFPSNDAENNTDFENPDNYEIEYSPNVTDQNIKKHFPQIKPTEQVRRPTDYIRREAVLRIKHLENKKRLEMQILKTQLDVEQIKKKSALLDEERQKTLLEKAKIELEELKNSVKLNPL